MNSLVPAHLLLYLVFILISFLMLFTGAFFLLWYYLKMTRRQAPPIVPRPPADSGNSVLLPLRLQACERLVLFLERIHPANLVMRLNDPGLSAAQFQALLVSTIRGEFEYNLSQQLYISGPTWERIRNAKEESILLINRAASSLPEESASADLMKRILEEVVGKEKLPVELAIGLLRKEI